MAPVSSERPPPHHGRLMPRVAQLAQLGAFGVPKGPEDSYKAGAGGVFSIS